MKKDGLRKKYACMKNIRHVHQRSFICSKHTQEVAIIGEIGIWLIFLLFALHTNIKILVEQLTRPNTHTEKG